MKSTETATPLRVVPFPVSLELWRPQGKLSFGILSEVVEVQNLYNDSRRQRVLTNFSYSALHRDKDVVFRRL